MTLEGQDYLESVRDNTRWGKIKKIAKEKGIPLIFNTVITMARKTAANLNTNHLNLRI